MDEEMDILDEIKHAKALRSDLTDSVVIIRTIQNTCSRAAKEIIKLRKQVVHGH